MIVRMMSVHTRDGSETLIPISLSESTSMINGRMEVMKRRIQLEGMDWDDVDMIDIDINDDDDDDDGIMRRVYTASNDVI
jgi:hypothetical protein